MKTNKIANREEGVARVEIRMETIVSCLIYRPEGI
jgi:hypothetical protein